MEYAAKLKSHCEDLPHPFYPRIEDLHDCVYDMKFSELPTSPEFENIKAELIKLAETEWAGDRLWGLTELFLTDKDCESLNPTLKQFFLGMRINRPVDDDHSKAAQNHYYSVTLPLRKWS